MLGLATWPALSSGALAGAEAEAVPLAQLGFCQADPGEPALAALVQTGPGAGGADLDHTHSPEPARAGRHTCTGAALHSRDLGQQSFHRCGLLALGLFPAFFPRAETVSSFQSQLTSHFLGDSRPDSPPNGIMPPCSFFLNIPGYFLSFGYHGFSV